MTRTYGGDNPTPNFAPREPLRGSFNPVARTHVDDILKHHLEIDVSADYELSTEHKASLISSALSELVDELVNSNCLTSHIYTSGETGLGTKRIIVAVALNTRNINDKSY